VDPLSNPVWLSLCTGHAHLAQGDATVAGYPADVAPFAAVPDDGDRPSERGLTLALGHGEPVYFIGRLPSLSDHVHVEPCPPILQMRCEGLSGTGTRASSDLRSLDDADTAGMLDLTGRVFPGYFRRRTLAMGQYVGVFDGDRLVAMGGERLFADRYREVSGICTDPSYGGRGYAGAIVRVLVTSMLERGLSPILHLSPANTRAHHLYQSLGFVDRAELGVVKVTV
jgi:ribosomal protein S18 acetylase RimI-like enzyme